MIGERLRVGRRPAGVLHGPRERVIRDLLPPRGAGEVRATGELNELRDRARIVGHLLVVAKELGWHDVVLAEPNEQQRRAPFAVDLGRRARITPEVRERVVPEDPCWGGDRIACVQCVRLLAAQRVGERVVELLRRERQGLALRGRAEGGRHHLDGRERDVTDPLDPDRSHTDAGDAEATIEQYLRERSAERVADDDRRALELEDDRLVAVEDLLGGERRDPRGIGVHRLDLGLHGGPVRRQHAVAEALVALAPVLPAARGQPEAVDQDDGVGSTHAEAHLCMHRLLPLGIASR